MRKRKPVSEKLTKNGKVKGRPSKGLTEEQIAAAVANSVGNVSIVATRLNCSWETASIYIHQFPDVAKQFEIENEKLCAMAVGAMAKAAAAGERWAVERIMETRARRSGFGLVQHVQQDVTSGGAPIRSEPQVIRIIDCRRKPPPTDAEPGQGDD